MTQNGKKILISIAVIVLTAIIAIGIVWAVDLTLTAEDKFISRASTSAFTVGINATGTDNHIESVADSTAATLTVSRTEGDGINLPTSYDLLVFSSAVVTADGQEGQQYTLSDGLCTVFTKQYTTESTVSLAFASSTQYSIAVVPADSRNVYVTDLFSLQMQNDQTQYNTATAPVPEGKFIDYKNIYIIDDITVSQNVTVSSPAFIHLLYSTLTINAQLTIKNNHSGIYAIESFEQGAILGDGTLIIDAPTAFYQTAQLANTIANTVTLQVNCEVDFSADTEKLAALVTDALSFAQATSGNLLYDDAVFVRNYHNYGVTINYAVTKQSGDGTLNQGGEIERGDDNGIFDVTATVMYEDQAVGSQTFNVTVAGQSDGAYAQNLAAYTQDYLSRVSVDGKLVNIAEISKAVLQFYQLSDFTGSASYSPTGSYVGFNVVNTTGSTTIDGFTSSLQGGNVEFAASGVTDIQQIILTRPDRVFEEITEIVEVTVGGQTGNISITLSSVGEAEKRAYLNRFIETPYFSDSDDTSPLLYIRDGAIYVGITEELVVPTTLGYTNISYNMYLVDAATLQAITDEASLQSVIDNKIGDYTEMFTYSNGILSLQTNAIVQPAEDQSLMLYVTFEGESSFSLYRAVVIPTSGLGGNDYTEYIKGDTFASYFSSLTDGRLINSVAGESGSAYKFTSEYNSQVLLKMYFDNVNDISSFCTFVYNSDPPYWQINIDIDHVPAQNTTVYVVAEFYVQRSDGTTIVDEAISIQNYSFIIPGIYRSGTDFDPVFYSAVVAATVDGVNLYESYDGYLLCDGADNIVSSLDLTDKSQGNISSLKGIHLLTGTSEFIFDGHAVTDIADLAKCGNSLKSLSMKDTGITDAMLANDRPMYALNGLTQLYLDNNSGITKLCSVDGCYFYRTVTTLSISNCSLADIDGLEEMAFLVDIDISNNNIGLFEHLTGLSHLKTVRLGGNVNTAFDSTDGNVYYGTLGEVNIPVYVTLYNRQVSVYVDETVIFAINNSATGILQGITEEQYNAALILNALIIPYRHFGQITLPQSVYALQQGGITYDITICYLLNGTAVVEYTSVNNVITLPSTAPYGDYSVIVSVTYGSATVYKQFDIQYLE